MVTEDEAGQHVVQEADKSRTKGTKVVPTTVLNPPRAWGVKAVWNSAMKGYNRLLVLWTEGTHTERVLEEARLFG